LSAEAPEGANADLTRFGAPRPACEWCVAVAVVARSSVASCAVVGPKADSSLQAHRRLL